MRLSRIHAYEVIPQKKVSTPVTPSGGLFKPAPQLESTLESLLRTTKLVDQAMVSFRSQVVSTGQAGNQVRDQLMRFCFASSAQSKKAGADLALGLSLAMDDRSKSLLLFLASYKEGKSRRVVIWAFPSDEAFQFKSKKAATSVEILTDVFNKSSRLRKAALFEGTNTKSDFWDGRVIDLQSSRDDGDAANYWIEDFLGSRLALEGKTGTRHLVHYLKECYEGGTPDTRDQLQTAMIAARRDPDTRFSYVDFADRHLSNEAKELFLECVPRDQQNLVFDFDRATFESKLNFRVFELANNVWVSSPLEEVGGIVKITESDVGRRLRVVGDIVDEKVKARHA